MSPGDLSLEGLQRRLGYRFTDSSLLRRALTHSSYSAEHLDESSYERLEFLGDAVLEMATTGMIFEVMPDAPEGEMTKVRASVVDEASLAAVAVDLGVPASIRLGKGEEQSGGRDKTSILSDVVEALLGAVFIDGGWLEADRVIRSVWGTIVDDRSDASNVMDSRSRLQEILARDGKIVTFDYERSGPDHATVFVATAIVDGRQIAVGTGGSKKAAAIDAARSALEAQSF
jgi:ribonuclease III